MVVKHSLSVDLVMFLVITTCKCREPRYIYTNSPSFCSHCTAPEFYALLVCIALLSRLVAAHLSDMKASEYNIGNIAWV